MTTSELTVVPPAEPRLRVSDGAIVTGLMIVATGLRSYRMAVRGFWGDETNMWVSAVSDFRSTGTAPLPPLLHRAAMLLTGSGDSFSFHLPTLVMGILFVAPMYFLGRAVGGRRAGLFAAFLTALSPTAIFFAQEGRPYSIFHCTCALAYLGFVKAFVDGDKRWWPVYGGAMVAGFLTHALTTHVAGGLAVGAVLYGLLSKPRSYRKVVVFLGLTAIVSLSFVWQMTRFAPTQDLGGRFVLPFSAFWRTTLYYLGTGPVATQGGRQLQFDVPAFFFLAFAVLGGVVTWRRSRFTVMAFASVFAVSLGILYFTVGERAYWPWGRYLSQLLPLYLVLIAAFFGAWCTTPKRLLIAVAGIVMLFLPGLSFWARTLTYDRSATDRAQAEFLLVAEDNVNAVMLIVPDVSQIDPRWMVAELGMFRRDRLPTFIATQSLPVQQIHVMTEGISRGLWTGTVGDALPAGRYALIVSTAPAPSQGCAFLKPFANVTSCDDLPPLTRGDTVIPVAVVNAREKRQESGAVSPSSAKTGS